MALVAFPAFLGGIGALFDSLAGTGPVLLIAFAAGGVVAAFASAWYRYERKIARHEAGKPWTRRAGGGLAGPEARA
jgi:F0F1-type ATP synthase assembly protein I